MIYVLIHHIIFWLYLYFLNILYFFKYSCTNIFHRRSLYTFYWWYVNISSLICTIFFPGMSASISRMQSAVFRRCCGYCNYHLVGPTGNVPTRHASQITRPPRKKTKSDATRVSELGIRVSLKSRGLFQFEDVAFNKHRDSHDKDKPVLRLPYLYNRNSYTGKTACLYKPVSQPFFPLVVSSPNTVNLLMSYNNPLPVV